MTLLSGADIRRLAEDLDFRPSKKRGQNFVVDGNTLRRIVRLAGLTPGEQVLEVGPGLGSLTLALLDAKAAVTALEIDPRLAEQLPHTVSKRMPNPKLTVLLADAGRITDIPGEPSALVANLPYNVTVPILLHLLGTLPTLTRAIVMVQAEVGQRLAARPGSRVYGAPSVKVAWYGDWAVVGNVSRQVFWPVPNVDSVLLSFSATPHPGTKDERTRIFSLVDAAFAQRRKTLRQALANLFAGAKNAEQTLRQAGIDPTARGEQLALPDYLRIARIAA